jgi:hypothetical protein
VSGGGGEEEGVGRLSNLLTPSSWRVLAGLREGGEKAKGGGEFIDNQQVTGGFA